MSKAEKAALKAYPEPTLERITTDVYADARKCYVEGYEQAEKDTLNRAVLWLKENAEKYIINITESYPDAPFKAKIGGKCWDDLAKALEEE